MDDGKPTIDDGPSTIEKPDHRRSKNQTMDDDRWLRVMDCAQKNNSAARG